MIANLILYARTIVQPYNVKQCWNESQPAPHVGAHVGAAILRNTWHDQI